MGDVHVQANLTNAFDEEMQRRAQLPSDRVRRYAAYALVNAGAIRTIIPQHVVERLGVGIRGQRAVEYADGRKDTVGVTQAIVVEIDGRDTIEEALVLGDEVLVGQTVLEKLDLQVAGFASRLHQPSRDSQSGAPRPAGHQGQIMLPNAKRSPQLAGGIAAGHTVGGFSKTTFSETTHGTFPDFAG